MTISPGEKTVFAEPQHYRTSASGNNGNTAIIQSLKQKAKKIQRLKLINLLP